MTTNWQPPGGTPPQPPGHTPQGPRQGRGRRFALIAILLTVIAGLATTAGLVLVNRDSDELANEAQYVVTQATAERPVFEAPHVAGDSPFFPRDMQVEIFLAEVEEEIAEQVEMAVVNASPGDEISVPVFDVDEIEANVQTGLYGGTVENTCDPERLIEYLTANPLKLEAWATAQGIPANEVPSYIRSLQPEMLAADYEAINHGYDPTTGSAYAFRTILAAGTAVLVDENGDVRARCYCGNPIRPPMPQDMPPRCIVFGAYVFVVPGGPDKRNGAPKDVLATGQETVLGSGAKWVEVKWGNDDDQRGWVAADNLRNHYCPPPTNDHLCPGPGETPVYANDHTTVVGHVTGTLNLHDGPADIFGPIDTVGVGSTIVENDQVLIHFTRASPSGANSGWVALADLQNDPDECHRIPQCIDTGVQNVRERAGGLDLAPIANGVMRVEFTGHFAPDNSSWAEVRLLDGTGRTGWLPTVFITALADDECRDTPPPVDCVEGEATVWTTSDGNDVLGYLNNASVDIIDPTPQDGRINIEMADGGPNGWVDEGEFFGGWDDCRPVTQCYALTGVAHQFYPNGGLTVGPVGPAYMDNMGKTIDGVPPVQRIRYMGQEYWAEVGTVLVALPDENCETDIECPVIPEMPREEIELLERERLVLRVDGPVRDLVNPDPEVVRGELRDPIDECCVAFLFNTPDVTDPVEPQLASLVTIIDSQEVDGEIWYQASNGKWFLASHLAPSADICDVDCQTILDQLGRREVIQLREIVPIGEDINEDDVPVDPEFDGSECCVRALFDTVDGAIVTPGPVMVDVAAGPTTDPLGWFQTTDGFWFPWNAVVDPMYCTNVGCPDVDPGNPLDDVLRRIGDDDREGIRIAATLIREIDVQRCCITEGYYDAPNGILTPIADPIVVIVIGEDPANPGWYDVVIPPLPGIEASVPADFFVALNDCRGGGDQTPTCPEASIIDTSGEGNPICCVQYDGVIGPVAIVGLVEVDGTQYWELEGGGMLPVDDVVFAGIGRCSDDDVECPRTSIVQQVGAAEVCCVTWEGDTFPAVLGGEPGNQTWTEVGGDRVAPADEVDYAPAARCDDVPEIQCDVVSIISEIDPLTCCVQLDGEPTEVTFTGQGESLGGGVYHYEIEPGGEWIIPVWLDASACDDEPVDPCPGQILISGICCNQGQQVENGQCVTPCPPGQFRDAAGNCVTPEVECEDRDDDGVCDVDDNCRFPNPGQEDTDGDGVADACDNCADVSNQGQVDTDGDNVGDACDEPDCLFFGGDTDGDGICDRSDNCLETPNTGQLDTDGDGIGDACDAPEPEGCEQRGGDVDEDGVCGDVDNCPRTYNPGQADSNGNGEGDACEPVDECANLGGDTDGDGHCDEFDNCYLVPNPDQRDSDGDGLGDACDQVDPCVDLGGDRDQDGYCGVQDNCPSVFNTDQGDRDKDGVGDACDNCPGTYNPEQQLPYPNWPNDPCNGPGLSSGPDDFTADVGLTVPIDPVLTVPTTPNF